MTIKNEKQVMDAVAKMETGSSETGKRIMKHLSEPTRWPNLEMPAVLYAVAGTVTINTEAGNVIFGTYCSRSPNDGPVNKYVRSDLSTERDLLEALRQISETDNDDGWLARDIARAAIARATGEA